MGKVIITVITALLCSIFSAEAQVGEVNWGVKGGANYSTFWDRLEMDGRAGFTYKYQPGFYLGGFLNIALTEKFSIQPELLFAHRQTAVELDGIDIGNEPVATTSRYRATRTESFIELPVLFRYQDFSGVFFEVGPQIGFLLDQKEEVEESPFGTGDIGFEEYDKFDAGLAAGVGVKLNSRFAINTRYFLGLVKRDNSVNSSVLNLGLEYVF